MSPFLFYFLSLISHWTGSVKIDLLFVKQSKGKCHKWLIENFLSESLIYVVGETCFLINTIWFCFETPKLKRIEHPHGVETVSCLCLCFHHSSGRTGEVGQQRSHEACATMAGA